MQLLKVLTHDVLPLDIEALRADLRIDSNEEDETLARMLKGAGAFLERRTGFVTLPGTYHAIVDDWPCTPLEIMRFPLRDLSGVKYLSARDTWTDVDLEDWQVSERTRSFLIAPLDSFVGSETFGIFDAVRFEFDAGFAGANESGSEAAKEMDPGIATLLAMLVAHWYKNRELFEADKISEIEMGAGSMLGAYRQIW